MKENLRESLKQAGKLRRLKNIRNVLLYPFAVGLTQMSNPFIKEKSKRISLKKLNKAYSYSLKNR